MRDLDSAFAALADSTRRAVIRELLREPLRAGELAARVEMSPPALSRHLRVLREAGLIVEDGIENDGRVSVYKVDLDAFAPVRHWLDEVEAHWHEQLASFKEYAESARGVSGRGGAVQGSEKGSGSSGGARRPRKAPLAERPGTPAETHGRSAESHGASAERRGRSAERRGLSAERRGLRRRKS